MNRKQKKSFQEILDWAESFTGVGVCVKDTEGGIICQSQGFPGIGEGSSLADRVFHTEIGKDSQELIISFGTAADDSTIGKIEDFIKTFFAQKITQENSIKSLSKEVVENYGEINLFYKLSAALLDITNIKETCQNILDQAVKHIPSEKASILLFEPKKKVFTLAAAQGNGLPDNSEANKPFDFSGCLLGESIKLKKPIINNNLENVSRDFTCGCHGLLGKHSLLVIPMPMLTEVGQDFDQEILGIIVLSDKKTGNCIYTSPDLKLLMSLAFQTSISICHWRTLAKVQSSKEALEETYDELMRTYETLQKQASLNEQINMVSKRIHAAYNIQAIFSALADYSKNLLRGAFCIAAFKKEDGSIHFQVTSEFKEKDRLAELSNSLKPGPFLNIFETGKPFSFDEEKDGPVDMGLGLKKTHIRNFIGIPIFCYGTPMGLIGVFNHLSPEGFTSEDTELLSSLTLQASTVLENASLINNLKIAQYTTMKKLAELAEKRDPETGLHLERMAHYSRVLAIELAKKPKYSGIITENYVESLFQSSPLHDIGKVGINDAILLKPGKLTSEEFDVMKTHATIGGEILEGPEFLKIAKNVALCHHEKFNGRGYPRGLKGEEIPLEARIVSLADVFDALTSKRVYKKAFPFEKTYAIILGETGEAFDPEVVEAFTNTVEKFKEVQGKHGD